MNNHSLTEMGSLSPEDLDKESLHNLGLGFINDITANDFIDHDEKNPNLKVVNATNLVIFITNRVILSLLKNPKRVDEFIDKTNHLLKNNNFLIANAIQQALNKKELEKHLSQTAINKIKELNAHFPNTLPAIEEQLKAIESNVLYIPSITYINNKMIQFTEKKQEMQKHEFLQKHLVKNQDVNKNEENVAQYQSWINGIEKNKLDKFQYEFLISIYNPNTFSKSSIESFNNFYNSTLKNYLNKTINMKEFKSILETRNKWIIEQINSSALTMEIKEKSLNDLEANYKIITTKLDKIQEIYGQDKSPNQKQFDLIIALNDAANSIIEGRNVVPTAARFDLIMTIRSFVNKIKEWGEIENIDPNVKNELLKSENIKLAQEKHKDTIELVEELQKLKLSANFIVPLITKDTKKIEEEIRKAFISKFSDMLVTDKFDENNLSELVTNLKKFINKYNENNIELVNFINDQEKILKEKINFVDKLKLKSNLVGKFDTEILLSLNSLINLVQEVKVDKEKMPSLVDKLKRPPLEDLFYHKDPQMKQEFRQLFEIDQFKNKISNMSRKQTILGKLKQSMKERKQSYAQSALKRKEEKIRRATEYNQAKSSPIKIDRQTEQSANDLFRKKLNLITSDISIFEKALEAEKSNNFKMTEKLLDEAGYSATKIKNMPKDEKLARAGILRNALNAAKDHHPISESLSQKLLVQGKKRMRKLNLASMLSQRLGSQTVNVHKEQPPLVRQFSKTTLEHPKSKNITQEPFTLKRQFSNTTIVPPQFSQTISGNIESGHKNTVVQSPTFQEEQIIPVQPAETVVQEKEQMIEEPIEQAKVKVMEQAEMVEEKNKTVEQAVAVEKTPKVSDMPKVTAQERTLASALKGPATIENFKYIFDHYPAAWKKLGEIVKTSMWDENVRFAELVFKLENEENQTKENVVELVKMISENVINISGNILNQLSPELDQLKNLSKFSENDMKNVQKLREKLVKTNGAIPHILELVRANVNDPLLGKKIQTEIVEAEKASKEEVDVQVQKQQEHPPKTKKTRDGWINFYKEKSRGQLHDPNNKIGMDFYYKNHPKLTDDRIIEAKLRVLALANTFLDKDGYTRDFWVKRRSTAINKIATMLKNFRQDPNIDVVDLLDKIKNITVVKKTTDVQENVDHTPQEKMETTDITKKVIIEPHKKFTFDRLFRKETHRSSILQQAYNELDAFCDLGKPMEKDHFMDMMINIQTGPKKQFELPLWCAQKNCQFNVAKILAKALKKEVDTTKSIKEVADKMIKEYFLSPEQTTKFIQNGLKELEAQGKLAQEIKLVINRTKEPNEIKVEQVEKTKKVEKRFNNRNSSSSF